MHSIKKAYVSFGMVTIPVRVYAATENRDIAFNQLHKQCHNRIRYQKYCPECDVIVENHDIEKGVETAPGEYAIFSDSELAELDVEDKQSISIVSFVDLREVDPIYFEKAYYLEPADVGHKPFKLLKTALERSGRAALAKVAIRQKEVLALLRPFGDTICMNMLHWPDEVRTTDHLTQLRVSSRIADKELDMALMLIDSLTTAFDPSAYQDERRAAILARIDEKTEDRVIAVEKQPGKQVIDLMKALEASIRAAQNDQQEETATTKTTLRNKAKQAKSMKRRGA